jgi:hypothetical protein
MKKSVLVFSMMLLFLLGGLNMVVAQEKPQPKKDTVNMDTDAKPTFYYAVEDEKDGAKKGGLPIVAIVGGAVVIVGAVAFFLLKKKK